MRRLRVITPEEQRILDGGAVDKAAYTARAVFTVDSEKLLERGRLADNTYGENESSETKMHETHATAYVEYSGKMDRFNYSFGLQGSYARFKQKEEGYNRYSLLPRLRLGYQFSDNVFIRYRTGVHPFGPQLLWPGGGAGKPWCQPDAHTRIIPGKCICGSEVRRLDFVRRIDQSKSMREMDELLFQFPELVDYCVRSVGGKKEITALFISDNGEELIRNVCAEKNIISLDCRKAEWSDRALYPAKRIIL